MRDWLTILIVMLIIGIVFDGLRRMRAQRRASLQMSRDLPDPLDDFDDDFAAQDAPRDYAPEPPVRGRPRAAPEPAAALEQLEPSLGDFCDLDLDDHADAEPPTRRPQPRRPAPHHAEQSEAAHAVSHDHSAQAAQPASFNSPPRRPIERPAAEPAHDTPSKPAERTSVKTPERASAQPAEHRAAPRSASASREAPADAAPDEVLIIHVMARAGYEFDGPSLLDLLLANNLRFGRMDIFHRHQREDGFGPVLFSLANMLKPGTFDLDDMESFTTPGVSLFLTLPIEGESIAAFDLMVDTARALAAALDAELKDENRSVMTRQTIDHSRQRVVEYERKRRLARV